MSTKRSRLLSLELERIKNILIKKYSPDKIIAFGSFVNKTTHKWSDLDIAIIKDTNKPFIDRLTEVSKIIDSGLATDVLVYTPKEMESMKKTSQFFLDEIIKKGKVIYDQNTFARS